MKRLLTIISCGRARITGVSFMGTCSGAPMHVSYAWAAAGTATNVANTKRSPQRLGESLT